MNIRKKLCRGCGHYRNRKQFGKHKRMRGGLQSRCRICRRKSDHKHYLRNKAKYLAYNRLGIARLRKEAAAIKSKAGCLYCDEHDPCCLDFHHRNSSSKVRTVCEWASACNGAMMRKEMKKCDVVCANCHRKLHAGRTLSPRI